MVLAGQLNKQLVASIGAAGQPAIGICGGDLGMFRASKKQSPDLGFVGEIRSVDTRWIERLWSAGIVPVVSSLALGFDGEYYNVNADQMASACAIACGAQALIYLTDVAGRERCRRSGDPLAGCEGDCADGRKGHRERRHAAQAGSLHQCAEEGRGASAHSACAAAPKCCRVSSPIPSTADGGDCFMNPLAFDRALERRRT